MTLRPMRLPDQVPRSRTDACRQPPLSCQRSHQVLSHAWRPDVKRPAGRCRQLRSDWLYAAVAGSGITNADRGVTAHDCIRLSKVAGADDGFGDQAMTPARDAGRAQRRDWDRRSSSRQADASRTETEPALARTRPSYRRIARLSGATGVPPCFDVGAGIWLSVAVCSPSAKARAVPCRRGAPGSEAERRARRANIETLWMRIA